MKWVNHKISTFSFVYFLTGNLLGSALAMVGSIFPDYIEGDGFKSERGSYRFKAWQREHRGRSHLFVLYFTIFACSVAVSKLFGSFWFIGEYGAFMLNNAGLVGAAPMIVFFFTLGCCCHILQDAFCGKVPIFSLRHRIGLRMFKVGSPKEYVYTLIISAILVAVRVF
jgi:inner membrane protein